MKNKKLILIIFSVIVFIVLVSGITYAAISWASDQDKGNIDLYSQCFEVIYVKGEDITTSNIKMGTSYKVGGASTEIKVSINDECTILGTGTLYLTTKEETTNNFLSNNILNYQVLDDGVEVSNGVISERSRIPIYTGFEVNYDVKTLTIYLWANSVNITDSNIEDLLTNAVYSGSISFEAVGDRKYE